MASFNAASGTIEVSLSDIPTPFIFLSRQLAYRISIATYIHIGATSVLIWDIINSLKSESKLLLSHKVGPPTIIYFITRITLLAYALGKCILLTYPVEDCAKLEDALNAFLTIFAASTTCFFFIRVSAVYALNRYIVSFFGTTWLSTVAMSVTFFKTFTAEHIGPTKYCIEKIGGPYLVPTAILLLVNDTLIYFAIAYQIYRMFLIPEAPFKKKLNLPAFKSSLPFVTKVFLLESQLYCLLIVLTKAFLVLAVLIFDAPASAMFIICHLVLVNILTCRVYRNIRLGYDRPRARRESAELYRSGGVTSMEFNDIKEGNHKTTEDLPETPPSTHTPDFQMSSGNRSSSETSAREEVIIEMSIHGHPSFFQGQGQEYKASNN